MDGAKRKIKRERNEESLWKKKGCHTGERRHSKMNGERAATWNAYTLKIRPTMKTLKSYKNTPAEFLHYPNSMCEIHEARHSIYKSECLGEQDRG